MSDSKIIYLHPDNSGLKPRGLKKRELEPVIEYRKYRSLELPAASNELSTYHYYKKLKGVFYKYGLGKQIVLDENDVMLAGMKHFKDLQYQAHLAPVFVFYNLTKEEKIALRQVAKDWELVQKKVWGQERRHD